MLWPTLGCLTTELLAVDDSHTFFFSMKLLLLSLLLLGSIICNYSVLRMSQPYMRAIFLIEGPFQNKEENINYM